MRRATPAERAPGAHRSACPRNPPQRSPLSDPHQARALVSRHARAAQNSGRGVLETLAPSARPSVAIAGTHAVEDASPAPVVAARPIAPDAAAIRADEDRARMANLWFGSSILVGRLRRVGRSRHPDLGPID